MSAEYAAWRWDSDSAWVTYPTGEEALRSLRVHGGGEVRIIARPPADDTRSTAQQRSI